MTGAMKASATAVAIMLVVSSSQAALLEVPNQYPTIFAACEAAIAGDTVGVHPGVYFEYYAVVRAGVTVLGLVEDSTQVHVRPTETGLAPFIAGAGDQPVVIENITISPSWHGEAIENFGNADLEVRRCHLVWQGPQQQQVTMIWSWRGNAAIRKSHIDFGTIPAQDQYVFFPYREGRFVVEDCVIELSEWTYMTLWSYAPPAGTVYEYTNNTIWGYVSGTHPGDRQFAVYLVNNILWDYNCGLGPSAQPEVLEFRYNCLVYTELPPDCGYQIGNFVADPQICDPAAGDFRLQPGSPCIGSGEGGEDVGARLGICWPTDVVESPTSVAGGSLWKLAPNPTTAGVAISLDGAPRTSGPCPIEIFDVTGKLVRMLGAPEWQSGVRAYWDGRLADGRDAPAGVYHIRVRHAGEEQPKHRLIMLR